MSTKDETIHTLVRTNAHLLDTVYTQQRDLDEALSEVEALRQERNTLRIERADALKRAREAEEVLAVEEQNVTAYQSAMARDRAKVEGAKDCVLRLLHRLQAEVTDSETSRALSNAIAEVQAW